MPLRLRHKAAAIGIELDGLIAEAKAFIESGK
jgi:hypothetical protein